jgi:para-nitrobenzyl esterase
MIGTNADDGYTLVEGANMTVPEYVTLVRNYFGNDADAVLLKYPANSTAEVQLRLGQIMTRYDFADSAKYAAGSMSDLNPDTYLYRYSYHIPGPGFPPLAFHGSETYLLFGMQVLSDPSVPHNIVDIWTRFAKTGDPNGGMNVTWPKYTLEKGRYLDIGSNMTVMSGY